MGDLIDRDAMEKELAKVPIDKWSFKTVCDALDKVPAVDAVTVVRCVDCIACFNTVTDPLEQYNGGRWWYCAEWDMEFRASKVDPRKYFCADGERRDGSDADT